MKSSLKFLVVSALSMSFASFDICASDSNTGTTLERIQNLTGVKKIIQKVRTDCENSNQLPSAEYMVESNPNYFGGINSKSQKWKEVKRIYGEYETRVCKYIDVELLSRTYTLSLLNNYNDDEIEKLEAFLLSDFGAKFIESGIKANSIMQKELSSNMAKESVRAIKWFEAEMQELLER